MSELKPLLQNVSLALILCAVLESVLPPSKGKRAFHLLCGVVIFTTLISSLRDMDLQNLQVDDWLTFSLQTSQEFQAQQNDALLLAAEKGYESAAVDALRDSVVAFSSVTAQCSIENETVTLQELTVAGVAEESKVIAQSALSSICEGAKISWVTEETQ